METVIDWNEAPEWAIGHGLIAFQGITRVWFNYEQYAVYNRDGGPYPWGGGKGDTRHNHARSEIQYPTCRPAPWTGEGLPPVGAVCEFQGDCAKCPSDPWHKELHDGVRCTVIAHFKSKSLDLVAFTFVKADGNSELEQSLPGALRPIRTPEQIAEDERSSAVNEMVAVINGRFGERAAEELYDAGWRKQVAS